MKHHLWIITLLFSAYSMTLADSLPPGPSTDSLARRPGALGDPFLGLIRKSPSYSVPRLNRFHAVVRGAPQSTTEYLINGCPLVLQPRNTDLISLSHQAVVPRGGSGFRLQVLNDAFAVGPFAFDGYRSWINGQTDGRIETHGSYSPVDVGSLAGSVVSISKTDFDDTFGAELRGSNHDGTMSGTIPIADIGGLRAAGRLGYNREAHRRWVEPYTSSGNFDYGFPLFGDYNVFASLFQQKMIAIRAHALGAFEELAVKSTMEPTYYVEHDRSLNHGGLAVDFRPTDRLKSETRISLTHHSSSLRFSPLTRVETKNGVLSVREKFTVKPETRLSPYLGGAWRHPYGTVRRYYLDPRLSYRPDTVHNTASTYTGFAGLEWRPFIPVQINLGARLDRYDALGKNSGSLFALSPERSLKDSVSVDATYRANLGIRIPGFARFFVSSGLYNQAPTSTELHHAPNLRSVKSAKHCVGIDASLPFGLSCAAEAYYHKLWDIPVYQPRAIADSPQHVLFSEGRRRSTGLEIMLAFAVPDLLSADLGYALSRHEVLDRNLSQWIPSASDRRHKVNAGITAALPLGFGAGLGILVCSGSPYTPIVSKEYIEEFHAYRDLYGEKHSAETDPIFDLSAKISYNRAIGPIDATVFVEGVNVLRGESEAFGSGENPFYESIEGKEGASIDSRVISFGIEVRY